MISDEGSFKLFTYFRSQILNECMNFGSSILALLSEVKLLTVDCLICFGWKVNHTFISIPECDRGHDTSSSFVRLVDKNINTSSWPYPRKLLDVM